MLYIGTQWDFLSDLKWIILNLYTSQIEGISDCKKMYYLKFIALARLSFGQA